MRKRYAAKAEERQIDAQLCVVSARLIARLRAHPSFCLWEDLVWRSSVSLEINQDTSKMDSNGVFRTLCKPQGLNCPKHHFFFRPG